MQPDPPLTDAFAEWVMTKKEIEGLLRLGTDWMDAALERHWAEVGQQPSDGSRELGDVFDQDTHGHSWKFARWVTGAALRDGVTALEVYLEKAREETLNHVGLTASHKTDKASPKFNELCEFYGLFGLSVDTKGVTEVRARRNILTHKRGETRRLEDRVLSHSGTDDRMGTILGLSVEGVLADLSTLGDVARQVDRRISGAMWPTEEDSDRFGARWLMDTIGMWALKSAGFVPIDGLEKPEGLET